MRVGAPLIDRSDGMLDIPSPSPPFSFVGEANSAQGTQEEIRPLTGLRAVLAWAVVAFHFLRNTVPASWTWGRRLLAPSHIAVDLFFVLSGYVLARRYAPESIITRAQKRTFFVRRLARLAPLYFVSLAIGFAASWPAVLGDLTTHRGRLRLALDLMMSNAWSHVAMFRYNWAAWSLSVEVFFYVCFPLLLPWIVRASRSALRATLFASWLATLLAPTIYTLLDPDHLRRPFELGDEVLWGWYLKFFPIQRLPEFVAGIAAARLGRMPRWTAPVSAVALLAVAMSGAVPYAYLDTGVLLPLMFALVAGIGQVEGGALASRPVVLLGHASYATYILHVPLFLLLARFDPALFERPAHVLAYMGFLAAVSVAAFHWVEQPSRRMVVARFLGRAPASRRTGPPTRAADGI
jgi:peptidoglycan/LPS O-acetylase OafA/YrhL